MNDMDERFTTPDLKNFIEYCMEADENTTMRYIEPFDTSSLFPSTANPSIVYDESRDVFWLNVRKISYTLHATNNEYNPGGHWGELIYSISQDRGRKLETKNAVTCMKDPMTSPFEYRYIKEKERNHLWDFQGNEDVRLAVWNNELYETYIIRDDNPTGASRVHYSRLDTETMEEMDKTRIPGPNGDTTYCEKNWMPVADQPFVFVSKADPEHRFLKNFDMIRGSSQLVPFKDGYVSVVHTCQMWFSPNGRKSARYLHAFVAFNRKLEIQKVSPLFSFMDRPVEFCCGLTRKGDDFYITFSIQDNISYILKTNEKTIEKFVDEVPVCTPSKEWFGSNCCQENNFDYAMSLYRKKDYSGAYTFFSRGIDLYSSKHDVYKERFYLARCIADLGRRDLLELGLWYRLVEYNGERPEGLMALAMYYYSRYQYAGAYYWGKKAMDNIDKYTGVYYPLEALKTCWQKIQQQNKNGVEGRWRKAF